MSVQSLPATVWIEGYEPIDRIGAGGYGEVWKADAPGGLAKAIKIVYGYLDEERATRELKALNRIKAVRHPFLISLERIEVVDGRLMIVTELAEMSLKDRFEQYREMGAAGVPRNELLAMLHDAADGLDYMRENFSLQHLDVKPENLLLVGGRVKVADFGLVKDLQDAAHSLVGGLTPVYASPEVFDGRASQQSDQYSLAIVYQELLTGELPFPGTTPSQLAVQHLQTRPRLASVPSTDRPILAKALAKTPADRFESCRALVEALMDADSGGGEFARHPTRPARAAESNCETTSLEGQGTDLVDDAAPHAPIDPGPEADLRTEVFADRRDGSRPRNTTHLPDLTAEPVITDLPPLDGAAPEPGFRPTVFVGVGGLGAQAVATLRGELLGRYGESAETPSFQILAFDTDGAALKGAAAPQGARLTDNETVTLPLRKPHQYRTHSEKFLRWISRRWLYNIPRSLQTEGLRPLGRLALVDHAERVVDALRAALQAASEEQAIAQTAATVGAPCRHAAPRVFLVGSICGGTGGGMLLDIGYAVGNVLRELGYSDDGVCAVLLHATDRKPSSRDLALANSHAFLRELQHYGGCGNTTTGDPLAGVPAMEGGGAPFAETYLIHLGDDLCGQQFDEQTHEVGRYLAANVQPVTGRLLDQWRDQTRGDQSDWNDGPLRLCAIRSIDVSPEPLPNPQPLAAALCGRIARQARLKLFSPEPHGAQPGIVQSMLLQKFDVVLALPYPEIEGLGIPEALADPIDSLQATAERDFFGAVFEQAAALRRDLTEDEASAQTTALAEALRAALATAEAALADQLESVLVAYDARRRQEILPQRIAAGVSQAEPVLRASASRHVLISVPAEIAGAGVETLTAQVDRPVTLCTEAGDDSLALSELSGVSLAEAALRLIDGRKDLIDVARRLQTRQDISWSPLLLGE